MLSPATSSSALAVRWAQPGDEGAISALYASEYGSSDSGHMVALYPFPQFFDPDWVRKAVESDSLAWMVAELDGDVVGTFGAVLNIGTPRDAITELFGLVVSRAARHQGAATRLFSMMMNELKATHFTIAETRTATRGAWRTVRGQGFLTLGFEPFAHMTPAGSESMILFGYLSAECRERRDLSLPAGSQVKDIANEVLRGYGLPDAPTTDAEAWPITAMPWKRLKQRCSPLRSNLDIAALDGDDANSAFVIGEDADLGPRLHAEWGGTDDYASGVISLSRMEGQDPTGSRYTEKFFVGRVGRQPLINARVVWDRVDGRARILTLRTLLSGLQGIVIAAIVNQLEKEAGEEPLTVVVDVRADCPELHSSLRDLKFFPTVYYPGLIARGSGRGDAVQFTRLHRLDYRDSTKCLPELAWPEAKRLVKAIGPSSLHA